MISNNKAIATEGSQVVRVHSGGGSPTSFLTRTTCFCIYLLYLIVVVYTNSI